MRCSAFSTRSRRRRRPRWRACARRHASIPRHSGADRPAVAPHLQGADAVLQDRRRVHGLSQRPAGSFHHGRRPGERALDVASCRAVPARRRRRSAADPERAAARMRPSWRRAACRRDARLLERPRACDQHGDRQAMALSQLVDGCARAGISAIAPWRDIVQACGSSDAAKPIRDAGITVTGLCRGGMFPAADEAGRRAAIDDNSRAVDEAAAHRRALPGAHRRRPAEGFARSRRRARASARRPCRVLLYAREQRAARYRAASSDVRSRPRVREHARARQRPLRRAGDGLGIASTFIMSGGTRPRAQIERAGAPLRLSRLRLARADDATC